ncbi:MAG: universal stress protein [Proteobacteria bacterium]|nr:universal stress protein [Pseudomonadota bacterium]
MLPFKKILCPTDFSEPSSEALKVASEMAAHFGSELLLLHVVTPVVVSPDVIVVPPVTVPVSEQELEEPAKKSLEEMVQRYESQGLRARFLLLRGNAADEILRAAEEEKVDQIVIATRGRTGLDRFIFGSVAEKVVRFAKCPVLTIPGRVSGEAAEETAPGGGKAPEEKSAGEKTYQEKVEAQLKEWGAKIDEMRAQAEKVKAKIIRRYEDQVGELRAKEEAVRQKMLEIRNVGEGAWEDSKSDMEKSLDSLRNDLERALSKLEETISETAQKLSTKKAGYVQRIEAQLKDWGGKIDSLKTRAETPTTEVKTKYLQQVEELRRKQETAREKLQEIKGSGGKAWEDMKGGVDQALADLKKGLTQAISRFKEK